MKPRCSAVLMTLLMQVTLLPGARAAEVPDALELTVQRTAASCSVAVQLREGQAPGPNGTLFCGLYGETGQMLEVRTALLPREGIVQLSFRTLPVPGQVVKVFLLDPAGWTPLSMAGVGEIPELPDPGEDETEDVVIG